MSKDDEKAIRKIYNPDEETKEDIKFVYDRKRDMEDSSDRQDALKRADRGRRAWENWREEKSAGQWQSNHIVPLTFSVIETAHSELINLRLRPKIGAQGEEDKPRAMVMKHIFDYTCNVSDWDMTLADIWQDTLIEGTAIGQEYYWTDKRMIQNFKIGKNNETETEQKEVTDYDDVYLESVRLGDFFVDEKAQGFSGPFAARDAIRRYIMDIKDFQSFFSGDIWDALGNAKYVLPGGDVQYYEWYHPPEGIKENEVEVLWYWGRKPYDRLWIVANDVLVVKGPNPNKHKQLPFARNVDIKRAHKFYGKGEPEILESMQDEQNTMRRMIIDRNHLDIDKMFIVSSRTALSDEDLIARPHGMIPSDDTNMAKPVEYGDIPTSVEISYKHLEDDSIVSTGINPRAQSLPTAGSATEAAILKESTLKRIQKKVWLMKNEFLPTVGRLRCANILQFYSQPRMEEIVGDRTKQKFQEEMTRLRERGLLVEQKGKTYRAQYRSIPIEGKSLEFDAKGQLTETSKSGTSFFEVLPKYFMPSSRGGYTITFGGEETLSVSKTLEKTQTLELYDRLMPLVQLGIYDPEKVGDMIVEQYNKDPDELKPDEKIQSESDQRLQMLIDLAGMENKLMTKGQAVPPTPNANPSHTEMHIAFIESDAFPSDLSIAKIFSDHVTGEILAIQQRQGSSEVPSTASTESMPGAPGAAGGQPAPISPVAGGPRSGMVNRPGGMPQNKTPMNRVMPGRMDGSGKI